MALQWLPRELQASTASLGTSPALGPGPQPAINNPAVLDRMVKDKKQEVPPVSPFALPGGPKVPEAPRGTYKPEDIKNALMPPAPPPESVQAPEALQDDGTRTVGVANPGWSQQKKYDFYSAMVLAHQGKISDTQPTVLALRGITPKGTKHLTKITPIMDDTMVVLTRDAQGPHVTELVGSTHAGQTKASKSVSYDANGDGKPDPGMIIPGNYEAVPHQKHNGKPSFQVLDHGRGDIPGVRDTDHDALFSDAEIAASAKSWKNGGNGGSTPGHFTGVLFHVGGEVRAGEDEYIQGVRSTGCLNPGDYDVFLKALGKHRSFHITLLDANDPQGLKYQKQLSVRGSL